MKKGKDQVSIGQLVFAHSWEDPQSDAVALQIKKNDVIMAITSGGCNVLGFLLSDPKIIYSIDINSLQSYMLELKIVAVQCLTFEEFTAFAGLKEKDDRLLLYFKMRSLLSDGAKAFWDRQKKFLSNGFIMNGKYERFVKRIGKFINLLQGKKRVLGLFADKTIEGQEMYFNKVWNTKRSHFMFKMVFNKRILAKRGLVADYFHFNDGSKSFAESFYRRSCNALRDIPIKGNYFLSLYLLGKYRNNEELPDYLKQENYDIIKSRINKIKIITAGAQDWIDTVTDSSIDCFALSNICELMSEKDTGRLFSAISRTAKPAARAIFRNLMIPREVPDILKDCIVKDELLSQKIHHNDRSFVYSKVAAYTINK
jgi:S-adenosylmethionine-diacylglycerol 3-amino-3-carboxypropyl transferase